MVSEGMISNYVRWLYFQVDWALAVIPALALVLWRLMRRPSIALVARAWVSAAFMFIALATITTDEHGTVGLNGTAGLAACVAGRSSWLPGSVADVFTDLLPNLALFPMPPWKESRPRLSAGDPLRSDPLSGRAAASQEGRRGHVSADLDGGTACRGADCRGPGWHRRAQGPTRPARSAHVAGATATFAVPRRQKASGVTG